MFFRKQANKAAISRHYNIFIFVLIISICAASAASAAGVGVIAGEGGTTTWTNDISVTGDNSVGALVINGSTLQLTGSVSANGDKAYGLHAASDNSSVYSTGNISVSGAHSHAIHIGTPLSARVTGCVVSSDGDISAAGLWAVGVFQAGANKTAVRGNISVKHEGGGSVLGVDMRGGYLKVTGNIDVSSEEYSYGVQTLGDGTSLDVTGDVTVGGNYSYGAYSRSFSEINLTGNLSVTGTGARAIEVFSNGTVNTSSGDVRAEGNEAFAVLAHGGNRSISTVNVAGNVYAVGESAYGAWSHTDGLVNITGNVTARGDLAIGAGAYGGAANRKAETNISGDISATGVGSAGVYADYNGTVNVSDGTIKVSGDYGIALYLGGEGEGTITLNNVTALTDSGILLSSYGYGSIASENGSALYGDVINENDTFSGKTLAITLHGASSLTGSVNNIGAHGDIDLTLSGTEDYWYVTGDSVLGGTLVNNGNIDYSRVDRGIDITVKELSGNGVFIMKTDISSPTRDRLIISETASGSHTIHLTGYDSGARDRDYTPTLVYDASGGATFELAGGYASLGLWRYGLTARTVGAGMMWELYPLDTASDTGSATINTFRGAWLMGYAETQTLLQRMGDLRSSPHLSGVWFRVHGGQLETDAGHYSHAFDMDYGGVQIGFDRKFEKWDGTLYFGAMFGYADGDIDFTRHAGDGRVNSRTLGVYGTYVKPDGFYLDAVFKYQWADNKFHAAEAEGGVISPLSASMGGFGMSLEAGKRFAVGEAKNGGKWYLEPQAQISHQYYDGGTFTTSTGFEVSVDNFKSLTGRFGVLVGYQTEKSNFYAKASVVKEFDGDMTIRSGGSSVEESFGSDWFVYGIGFTSRINDKNSLYLDVERTSGGNFEQPWRVTAGWRVEF